MKARSFSARAANDNQSTGAFTVTEVTMVGFAISLLVAITAGTLVVCGVL